MKSILLCAMATLCLVACTQKPANNAATLSQSFDKIDVANTNKEIACKLTAPELQARKATVLTALKEKVLEKTETEHGYAFRFAGDDETLGQLMVFIQAERQCCDFFTFKLGMQDPGSPLWLEISGGAGAKAFIRSEMGL